MIVLTKSGEKAKHDYELAQATEPCACSMGFVCPLCKMPGHPNNIQDAIGFWKEEDKRTISDELRDCFYKIQDVYGITVTGAMCRWISPQGDETLSSIEAVEFTGK